MSSIFILAFFILLISHLSLRDRVKKLEEESSSLASERVAANITPSPLPSPLSVSALSVLEQSEPPADMQFSPLPKAYTHRQNTEQKPIALFVWFKEHTLIKIGGIFFFLGAAWFVSYAIKAGWLSPELRILLGYLLALGVYLLGVYRARLSVTEHLVLTALGTAIMVVTALAGTIVFALTTPAMALIIVAGAIGYTTYVALRYQVEWLTTLAALAGVLAPLFVTASTQPGVLLAYLTVLIVGLAGVGVLHGWRTLLGVLIVGVWWHEASLVTRLPDASLFVYVALCTGFLYSCVTAIIVRLREVVVRDITLLSLLCVGLVLFTSRLTEEPGLVLFAATVIVGATGYTLMHNHFSTRIIAVYLGLASVLLLIGTSFLFSGYSLVLAFAVEVTGAFFIATYLGLPERFVAASALAYVLPVGTSLVSLESSLWDTGIWHVDAIAVYVVLGSLIASALWLVHKPGVAIYPSSRSLAAAFGVAAFVYAYLVTAVVTHSLLVGEDAFVMMYVSWALISLSVLYYALTYNLPARVVMLVMSTFALPTLVSFSSLSSAAWLVGAYHIPAFGVWSIVIILFLAILLLTQEYCRELDLMIRRTIGLSIVCATVYLGAVLAVVWGSVLEPTIALVAIYVSYALILYGLVSLFVLVRVPTTWLQVTLSAFVIPAAISVSSLKWTDWAISSFLPPEAVGLFTMATLSVLVSLGLTRYVYLATSETGKNLFVRGAQIFMGMALAYMVALVWALAHTYAEASQAVSIALFVYTVAGLTLYLIGKRRNRTSYVYAGTALLAIVILRLLLIEVAQMELMWRFITFLGIGALFIGAAFIERGK